MGACRGFEKLSLTTFTNSKKDISNILFGIKPGHNYYVYIIECKDRSYYTGITNDIERRLWEHNTGYDSKSYTFTRRPVELKYYEHFHDVRNAIAREKQIKGWSRKKKEALFENNWEKIKEIAKSKNHPSTSSG